MHPTAYPSWDGIRRVVGKKYGTKSSYDYSKLFHDETRLEFMDPQNFNSQPLDSFQ